MVFPEFSSAYVFLNLRLSRIVSEFSLFSASLIGCLFSLNVLQQGDQILARISLQLPFPCSSPRSQFPNISQQLFHPTQYILQRSFQYPLAFHFIEFPLSFPPELDEFTFSLKFHITRRTVAGLNEPRWVTGQENEFQAPPFNPFFQGLNGRESL